jgi:hypothetical protein
MFYMNGEEYDLGMTSISAEAKRTMTSMGAYVIIMPDKMYFNTKDTEDKGKIEASYDSEDKVKFKVCRADGTDYDIDVKSPDEPKKAPGDDGVEVDVWNGCVWLDTSQTPASLKVYSTTNGMWSSVSTTYIKICCPGIGNNFDQFDGVKISGVTISQLEDLNNTMVIYAKDDNEESSDWIVVVGIMDSAEYEQEEQIKIERLMPQIDFIVESNNRLWGCRYGENNDGDVVNELYACKLGDFKNWNCFLGISTDSYYVSLGTDGRFTGAISYLGYPTFFKENCIHTVYGNYPAEYRVQDTACRGVQKGSHGSLAMVNEVLYYKSRTGICAYSGSLPSEISSALGEKFYTEAVGCAHKGKYYVSMKDADDGKYHLFVCDSEKAMWHKEEDIDAIRLVDHTMRKRIQSPSFCVVDDEIYFIDSNGDIRTMFGSGTKDTEPVEWIAETGLIGCSAIDKKYVSRLTIRLKMEIGAQVNFYIQYDSSGEWVRVCNLVGHNLRTNTLPIRPKRCDHFRMRIEGVGEAKIFSISKTIEQGSEL